jgi:hypothetical protein
MVFPTAQESNLGATVVYRIDGADRILAWSELENGIEVLGLFQIAAGAPAVTHSICESCENTLLDLPNEVVTLGPLPI